MTAPISPITPQIPNNVHAHHNNEGALVTGNKEFTPDHHTHSADLPSADLLVEEGAEAAAFSARANIPLHSKIAGQQNGLDITDIEQRYTSPNNGTSHTEAIQNIEYDIEFHNYAMFATTTELNRDIETIKGNFHDKGVNLGLDIGIELISTGLDCIFSPIVGIAASFILGGIKDLGMHIKHKRALTRAKSIIGRAKTKTNETLDTFRMGYLYAESTLREFYSTYSPLLSQIDYSKHGGKQKVAKELIRTLFTKDNAIQLKKDTRSLTQISRDKIMTLFASYGVHDKEYESSKAIKKSRSIA